MPLVLGRRAAAFPRGRHRDSAPCGRGVHAGVSRPLHGAEDGECARDGTCGRGSRARWRRRGWVGRENARKGSTAWRIKAAAVASDTQLAGYADRVSIRPGEPLHLYVSTTARSYTVRAFRLGWYGGARARLVSSSPVLRGTVQGARTHRRPSHGDHPLAPVGDPGHARLAGGHLPAAAHRQPGAGQVHPRHRPVGRGAGRLVLMNAVTTYQAYNTWGGYSLYGGPATTSAPVPTPSASTGHTTTTAPASSPTTSSPSSPRRSGPNLPLAYLTNVDLEHSTHVLDGARGLVSLGHDEYWTTAMRQRVTAARDHGVNLAFMGANAVYWRIRLQRSALGADRVVVGYKSAALDPLKRSAEHDRDVAAGPPGRAGEQPRGDAVRVLPRAGRPRGPRPGFVPVPRHRGPQGHDVRRAGRDRDRPRLSRGRHPGQPAGAGALAGRLRARPAHLVRRDVLLHALGVRGSSPSGRCCGTRASRGRTPSTASPSGR